MKKYSIILCLICCFSFTAMAQISLEDLLNSTKKSADKSSSSGSSVENILNSLGSGLSSSSSSSTTEDITSALGNIISSAVASNQQLTVADLQGTWKYSKPACKFKSSDFLKSAGGEFVSSQVSSKLKSVYNLLGFKASSFSLTCENDGDFIMQFGKVPIKGSASRASQQGYFTFEFVKLGSYSLTKVPAYIEIVGDKMVLLFEVDEFVDMFKSLVGKAKISTLNKILSYTDNYDGILIGFEMKRK